VSEALSLPSPCVVVLVGPGASGKSTWAAAHFPAEVIVSSDRLRALVGSGEDDIAASADAFALMDEIVGRRLARRLTTVIDTLGLDAERRAAWRAIAHENGLPCIAVAFDTPPGECRERNRRRDKRIPADALSSQLRGWATTRDLLPAEGYHTVLEPQPVRVVPEAFVAAAQAARRQEQRPTGLRFGLQIGSFSFDGGSAATAAQLAAIAGGAEAAGFDAIYVMDHLIAL
jgi:predicted kinase